MGAVQPEERWSMVAFVTFEDLEQELERTLRTETFDAVIHCAAVSDYRTAGVFAPDTGTRFDPDSSVWKNADNAPRLVDVAAAKVKSNAPELWLRLVRTPKLIDRIRRDWSFRGVLVKFKLEAGVSDERLLEIAEQARQQSAADYLVANTLEGASSWAFLGPLDGVYERVSRAELPRRLLEAVEQRLHE